MMKVLKTVLALTMCLMLLAASTVIPASAIDYEKGADAVVYMDTTGVKVGDTFTVTVYIENITAPNGVLGCDIPLEYDSEHLELVDRSAICPKEWVYSFKALYTATITPEENPYWLRSLYDGSDILVNQERNIKYDKGIGFNVTFKAKSVGRSYIKTVTKVGNFTAFVVNGDMSCTNYSVGGNQVNFVISESGAALGDVNGDSYTDSFDASMVLRYEVNLISFDDNQKAVGDINGDGKINAYDASLLLRYEVGLIESF